MADRAVATPSAAATIAAPRKTAARVVNDSALEREADRAGEAILRGPTLLTPRGAPPRLHAIGLRPTMANGRALDASTRTFMESRFGYDFSSVRVHHDRAAASAASAFDALAYTSGADIVFGENEFAPHQRAGRWLLAHELAHVVQQQNRPEFAYAVQRQSTPKGQPATPVWYQDAIDQIELSKQRAAEQQKQQGYSFPDYFIEDKRAILELCEAIDQKLKDVIPARLEKVLKASLMPHQIVIYRDVLNEASARVWELGLDRESELLRTEVARFDRMGPGKVDEYARQRKINFLTRLVAGAARDAKSDTPDGMTASLHRYARVYVLLRDEFVLIDWKAVEWDKSTGSGYRVMRPHMSEEMWADALTAAIGQWLRGLAILLQTGMDTARRDLESTAPTGTGKALLEAMRNGLAGEVHDVLFPKDDKKNIAGEAFPITTTRIGKGEGTISDQFAQGKEAKARAVPITTYNPEHENAQELRASLARFYRVRIDQLDVLGRIYGAIFALKPEKTFLETLDKAEKALDTGDTIKRMPGGRLRLDNDDDWRAFVLQRYQDLTNPPAPTPPTSTTSPAPVPAPLKSKPLSPEDALHEVIDLLFRYLEAFTVHARFTNIYDVGETNYLNRPFPRALTGQLVHDCGVYALRAAYILSLVRKELGLRFRFVSLPLHLSLVITRDKFDAYIIHNDQFHRITAAELEARRKQWEKFKDPQTQQPVPGPIDEEQFIGEVAADYFDRRVDMPFRVTEVRKPVADARTERAQLWKQYQEVSQQKLFGTSTKKKNDPNYLFELRYLELTEESRKLYNKHFVPFWNEKAPGAWDALQKTVHDLANQPGGTPRTKLKVDDLMTPVANYSFDFDEASKEVKAAFEAFDQEKARLSARLRADPKLVAKDARLSSGIRAASWWRYYWVSHAQAISDYETDLLNRPTDGEEPVEAIQKALDPPFIPLDEKRAYPLD